MPIPLRFRMPQPQKMMYVSEKALEEYIKSKEPNYTGASVSPPQEMSRRPTKKMASELADNVLEKTALARWQVEAAKDVYKGTPLNMFEQEIAKRMAKPSANLPWQGNTLIRDFMREAPPASAMPKKSPLRDVSEGSPSDALAKLREKLRSTPGGEVAEAACALPTPAAKSKLLRNIGIGAGAGALSLGGLGVYGGYRAKKNRDAYKSAAEYPNEMPEDEFLAMMTQSNQGSPPPPRLSRTNSAISGALMGAGLGVMPAYMGSFSPKHIALASGLGALAGGVGGAFFPTHTDQEGVGNVIAGGAIPTLGHMAGGLGGAALGHKLLRGHMLGRVGLGFPGSVLGGIGGSMLARKLLSPPKEASEIQPDMMRILMEAATQAEQRKLAEMKEENTKSLHAPKYDRRMKFSTALDRSEHSMTQEIPQTPKDDTPSWLKEAAERILKHAFDTTSFDQSGVTGREGVITVEDELMRTPPLPTEDLQSYDVGNKPVMQKESEAGMEDMEGMEGEGGTEGQSDKDLYSFTQRHPSLVPILMGLGGAALGAVPGAFGGGRLSVRSLGKQFSKNVGVASDHAADLERAFARASQRATADRVGPAAIEALEAQARKARSVAAAMQAPGAKDFQYHRNAGRVGGGLLGGLTGGALGTLGGLKINKPQPWEE